MVHHQANRDVAIAQALRQMNIQQVDARQVHVDARQANVLAQDNRSVQMQQMNVLQQDLRQQQVQMLYLRIMRTQMKIMQLHL